MAANLSEALTSGLDSAEPLPEKLIVDDAPRLVQKPRSIEAKSTSPPKTYGGSIPEGFTLEKEGVYFLEKDKKGTVTRTWVCSPLAVLALTRNMEGQDWGRLLRLVDPDGQEKTWAMPMSLLSGDGAKLRAELLSLGLRLAPGRKSKELLEKYLILAKPEARALCVNRIGWYGSTYVLPDQTYGPQGAEPVLFQGSRVDHAFKMSGSLKNWQTQIGRLCVGNSRLVLAVSAAFAAPLLAVAEAESGGFHFRGGSSIGKTTALHVAGSVWGGGGVASYINQWRATANALEGVALAHCDALLCLDELSQVNAKEAGEIAYLLANGQSKARMNRDAVLKTAAPWRVLFLSTGEIGLADKIFETGGRATAGQAVRVIDLPAVAGDRLGLFQDLHNLPDAATFARQLKEASARYYGTPARAFLEKLTADQAGLTEALGKTSKAFMAEHFPKGADGQVERVCARFAFVAAAGELAIRLEVLSWPKGEAIDGVGKCFQSWLAQRGTTGPVEIEQAIDEIRNYFLKYKDSDKFPIIPESVENTMHESNQPTIGYRKKSKNESFFNFLIRPEILRKEILKRQVPDGLNKELVNRQYVIPDKEGHATRTERLPGHPKPVKVYKFTSLILGNEPGEEEENRD